MPNHGVTAGHGFRERVALGNRSFWGPKQVWSI